nr:helix-turn-helix transcriptional regulator [uncultured Rhodoferax sp.]
MTLIELIDAAKQKKGSLGAVAAGLSMDQTRLSDWKKGRRRPDANEIAYLAECAELNVLETVAEIQGQMDERFTHIWAKALGNLRAAGVAATVTMAPLTSSAIEAVSRVVKS